ncbi:MAG: T9SS type A sorting domain-containing protein [Bacteroidota bacterium]
MKFCTTNLIKKRCTNSPWTWRIFTLLLFIGSSLSVSANNGPEGGNFFALGCHDQINLSLDTANCEATIDSSMILTGTIPAGNYLVELFYDLNKTMPVPTSPRVTAAEVGLRIVASVTNSSTGNSCWGYINVEDKFLPDLLCGDGDTVSCTANIDPTLGGTPGFPLPANVTVNANPNNPNEFTVLGFDACSEATLSYVDLEIGGSTCGDFNRIVKRTWTVSDAAGNTGTCMDTIYLENLSTAFDPATDCPPDWFAERDTANNNNGSLLCDDRRDDSVAGDGVTTLGWNTLPSTHRFAGHPAPEDELYAGSTNIKWAGTGMPAVGACAGVQMTFTDTRLNICSSGASEGCYKIIRDWVILDWCTGAVNECQQIIKVEDQEAPTVSGIEDLTISVDIWRCEVDWIATVPTLMDNCSSAPLDYSVSSLAGTAQQMADGRFRIDGLTPGTYEIFYNTSDCCGNRGQDTIQLTVVDEIPPVAVCDQNTVVGLTANNNPDGENGISKVFAQTFDDGSFDNCSDQVWFKVLRMDEFDSNNNGKPGETVSVGDWESIACDGVNGDDDPRTFPGLGTHPNFNRSQSYFDDFVKVCCADSEEPIQIVFRVFDVDPTPYEFRNRFPVSSFPSLYAGLNPDDFTGVMPEAMSVTGPLFGHYSDCMVSLQVDDKIPPFVVAPPNVWVSCDFDFPFDPENPNDFTDEFDAIFGKVVPSPASLSDLEDIIINDRVCDGHPKFSQFAPANPLTDPCYENLYDINWGKDGYATDNCSVELEQTILSDLTCGKGQIIRRWKARDLRGNWSNTATQVINIIDCRDFYVPTVCWRFSGDRVGQCNTALGQYQLIAWPCDVTLTSCAGVTDEAFEPENLNVSFEQDREPQLDRRGCNFLAATYTDRKYVLEDNACLKIFREWSVIDWCLYEEAQANPNANIVFQWDYTQVIKLINTQGPEFTSCSDVTIDGFGTCNGAASLPISVTDDCTPTEDILYRYEIDIDNDGTFNELGYSDNHSRSPFNGLTARIFPSNTPNADGTYKIGTHRIVWTATDGCGNSASCVYLFTIRDAKPPTAFCLTGVSTIPMPDTAGGFVDVFANDFNLRSIDNCTDSTALVYSFSLNINDNSRRFTCDDAGSGTIIDTLTVYVWDAENNFATCNVRLTLSDCANQSQATISGGISSEEGESISDVMVRLEGNLEDEQMTLINGSFNFNNLPVDYNYSIRPEKNKNPLNGISTYDLVLISKHVLGLERIQSPYRLIAADVNNSGSISAFDMVDLRKLILFIETEFENNTSWRFIPADYVFPDPSSPFSSTFPEVYTINNLNRDEIANFVAIKTGDVNNSARPNLAVGSEERTASGSFDFQVADRNLQAGQTYTVDFNTAAFDQIAGLQFSLNFDRELAEVTKVIPQMEGMTTGNFGTHMLDKGVVTSSFVNTANATEGTAFRLEIRAKRDAQLSDILSISSEFTPAEAYTQSNEFLQVGIDFGSANNAGFALLQNSPNPFKDVTLVRFQLPYSMDARLSIYDAAGKKLKVVEAAFEGGLNEVQISKSELAGSGVLYYTLESEVGTATRKMILLD